MATVIERIEVFCFAASYGVALGLEVWHQLRPRPIGRLLSLAFGGAGLLAQALFFAVQSPPLGSPQGSLFFLALILAVFYLYGSIHHGRLTWGLFVLPLVLGLVVLGAYSSSESGRSSDGLWWDWGLAHGILLVLAGVGISVGFVASLMYLVQVHRLRAKVGPGHGLRLWSLERLEVMNRRAILWSFPLLTAGLLVGLALQLQQDIPTWASLKILSTLGLWVVFAILLYLRYGVHVRGRQAALWTVFAFALLLFALVSPHALAPGGSP